MKGEQGSEGEKKQRNKREAAANSAKEENVIKKPDFIHVRARRGQATDSHSLAERVSFFTKFFSFINKILTEH